MAPAAAGDALRRGIDVYLFLIGMMALAEFAQRDGLFAWVAVHAIRSAGTSRLRLFAIVYAVGVATTALLSNDATIVVLTPAVLQALAHYDAPALPYVVACAMVANAASFVLPISNPANLLVFAGRMPGLGRWFETFALPALIAIAVTFGMLAWYFRRDLRGRADHGEVADVPPPSRAGVALLAGSALTLIVVSAREGPLGAATFTCAAAAWIFAFARRRADAVAIVRDMDWRIVPLTAALFVIIAAIDAAGALAVARAALAWCGRLPLPAASLAAGALASVLSNAVNNLPIALAAGQTLPTLATVHPIANAVLVGVNLGPNQSVNGSLATILWLGILRRYGIVLSARAFAVIGLVVAPPALFAALLAVTR